MTEALLFSRIHKNGVTAMELEMSQKSLFRQTIPKHDSLNTRSIHMRAERKLSRKPLSDIKKSLTE